MNATDRKQFMQFWNEVLQDEYDKTISTGGLIRAFDNLSRFELSEIENAVKIHLNSEDGRFRITVSHVVTILEGAGEVLAARSFDRLLGAIRSVGAYEDVVFDDPILHAIIQMEGGWIKLCLITESELPYFKNRFTKIYISLKNIRVFDYPKMLTGITNAQNKGVLDDLGAPVAMLPPSLIGDREKAQDVYRLGQEKKSEVTHSLDIVAEQALKMLVNKPTEVK